VAIVVTGEKEEVSEQYDLLFSGRNGRLGCANWADHSPLRTRRATVV
jgi:hypothetical protein